MSDEGPTPRQVALARIKATYKVTIGAVAKELGVSRTTLYRWARGAEWTDSQHSNAARARWDGQGVGSLTVEQIQIAASRVHAARTMCKRTVPFAFYLMEDQ